jgi:hypothetical protein
LRKCQICYFHRTFCFSEHILCQIFYIGKMQDICRLQKSKIIIIKIRLNCWIQIHWNFWDILYIYPIYLFPFSSNKWIIFTVHIPVRNIFKSKKGFSNLKNYKNWSSCDKLILFMLLKAEIQAFVTVKINKILWKITILSNLKKASLKPWWP